MYGAKNLCASSSNISIQSSKRKYEKLSVELMVISLLGFAEDGHARNVPKPITHVHSSCSAQKTFGLVTGVKFTVPVRSKFPLHHSLQASLSVSGNFYYFFLI